MQNFPKISALILVVGLVAAVILSIHLRQARVETYQISSAARAKMVYLPRFGIDKFWADVSWMRTVNLLGALKGKMDDQSASFFVEEFQKLTDLDPDMALLYTKGIPHVAYQKVDKAIELMEKGDKVTRDTPEKTEEREAQWKRLHQAAHWIIQVKVRAVEEELRPIEESIAEAQKKDDEAALKELEAKAEKLQARKVELQKEARDYLSRAMEKDAPWYVENLFLHTTARIEGKYGDPLPELESWYNYYKERLKKLREEQYEAMPEEARQDEKKGKAKGGKKKGDGKKAEPEAADDTMAEGAPPPEEEYGYYESTGDATLSRLRKRIETMARSLMRELLEKEQKAKADKDEDALAAVHKKQGKVRGIFADITTEAHYSPKSLLAYDQGDLFDRLTGTPVTPYGVDLYDLEINGVLTPVKGDYNTRTGRKVVKEFDALIEVLKSEGKALQRLKAHTPEAVTK